VGDLGDTEYRRRRDEVERQLVLLPDDERLVLFDHHRGILLSMAENLDRATPSQQAELVALLVERVVVAGGAVRQIVWTPAARPFFGTDGEVAPSAPAGDGDPLAWYAGSPAAAAAGGTR